MQIFSAADKSEQTFVDPDESKILEKQDLNIGIFSPNSSQFIDNTVNAFEPNED